MRTANLASQSARQSDVGKVWEEVLSGSTGSLEIPKFHTFRVRATGGTTVTIDGVLAMTMSASEIELFNSGAGDQTDTKNTVTVVIAAAGAYVQVAREKDR